VASSSALVERPEFSAVSNLGTIDILATRLWLDQRIILRNPSNVIAGFEPSTGATLFDLNALQVTTEFRTTDSRVLNLVVMAVELNNDTFGVIETKVSD
jgi:hypothetical protein